MVVLDATPNTVRAQLVALAQQQVAPPPIPLQLALSPTARPDCLPVCLHVCLSVCLFNGQTTEADNAYIQHTTYS